MTKFEIAELIGKTSRLLRDHLSKSLFASKVEVTAEQWIILQILRKGSKSQKDLSLITLKTKATINSLIFYLLKGGFVTKKKSKTDKRNTEISITDKGLSALKESSQGALENIEKATFGFSDTEIEELTTYLTRVQNNLLK